ncbi:MAG: hypothetical protein HUJ29_07180 [Gammaproteobacteria bacterium]|nr:hypothetical protein [Gammaproteobacteria bacterium]
MEDKVLCKTPSPNKKPTRIARWKYDAVRRCILKSIDESDAGLLFKELPDRVANHLSADERARLGSIAWYTTTVKLDMEVAGEIQRSPGKGPQKLTRKD